MGILRKLNRKVGDKLAEWSTCPKCRHMDWVRGCNCSDDRCVCNPKVRG